MAAARGEVDGYCGLLISSLKAEVWDDYKSGRVKVPIQMGLERHPDLPDVPNVFELVKTDEDRSLLKFVFGPWSYGRPIVAPPDVPQDRLEALRTSPRPNGSIWKFSQCPRTASCRSSMRYTKHHQISLPVHVSYSVLERDEVRSFYCSVMWASRMTVFHFASSVLIQSANASGVCRQPWHSTSSGERRQRDQPRGT